MKIQAYGSSIAAKESENFDCHCLGPIVGSHSVRLEVDTSSTFVRRYGILAAVADTNPEVGVQSASEILLEELVQRFYSWESKGTDEPSLRRSMGAFLDEANQALLSRLADEERVSSSTTVAGFALVETDVAVIFHVGDCRVLRDSGGYLRNLTDDHIEVRKKYRGKLEQATLIEDAAPELTRFVGILGGGQPDIRMYTWGPGDTFLAGSKGWHGLGYGIAREAIKTALNAYHDVSDFVERSLREAVRADGRADASLVAVRIV